MGKIAVSAIIPAYNEEKNISRVLKVIAKSPLVDEIIVVNDGSTDQTAKMVQDFNQGVKLINLSKNQGKADALLTGAQKAKGMIVFFCDADLIGLTQVHLKKLILPVKSRQVEMTVGSQEYMNTWSALRKKNLSELLKTLGGERALWKKDLLKIKNLKGSGYGIEQNILNYFVKQRKSFKFVVLENVGHVWKFKKWGFLNALKKESKAIIIIGIKHLQYLLLKKKASCHSSA